MFRILTTRPSSNEAIKFFEMKDLFSLLTSKTSAIMKSTDSQPIVLDVSAVTSKDHQLAIIAYVCRYTYRFKKYVTDKTDKTDKTKKLPMIHVYGAHLDKTDISKFKTIWDTADLVNEPSNVATPTYMCQVAKKMLKGYANVRVTVLDHSAMAKEGLNLILAVGAASKKQSKLLVMEYRGGNKNAPPICLCGKGVVFDAGGVNLKTKMNDMFWSMKGDKTGGCIVIGMMRHFAETRAKVNVVAVVPLVENTISGVATNPGDIIKSHKGYTVEITNTDAEGRLILADAFSYCSRFNPAYLLDFATLTKWAGSLHCQTSAVYFCADKKIHNMIDSLAVKTGERMWGMPTWMDSMVYCKSQVADLKNNYFKTNGTCTEGSGFMAAMFLAHFVPCKIEKWIHFDICNNKNNHYIYVNAMNTGIEMVKMLFNIK